MLILGHIYGHPHTCDQQEACQGMLGALKWSVRAMRKFGEEFKFSIEEACMAFEITTKLSNKTVCLFFLSLFPNNYYNNANNLLFVNYLEPQKLEKVSNLSLSKGI